MTNYSLEKLTATKPEWSFAFMFIQGMDSPIMVKPGIHQPRWLRNEDTLIITIPEVVDPMNPGVEGGQGPDGFVEAREGTKARLETHINIDQINAINFYTPLKQVERPKTSAILTQDGEKQLIVPEEKVSEGTENSVKENSKAKGGKKSKDNPLTKAE